MEVNAKPCLLILLAPKGPFLSTLTTVALKEKDDSVVPKATCTHLSKLGNFRKEKDSNCMILLDTGTQVTIVPAPKFS